MRQHCRGSLRQGSRGISTYVFLETGQRWAITTVYVQRSRWSRLDNQGITERMEAEVIPTLQAGKYKSGKDSIMGFEYQGREFWILDKCCSVCDKQRQCVALCTPCDEIDICADCLQFFRSFLLEKEIGKRLHMLQCPR